MRNVIFTREVLTIILCEHLLNWDPAKSQEGMSNPLDGCTLRDGDRTALHGLTSHAHLNLQPARVLNFDKEKQRHSVEMITSANPHLAYDPLACHKHLIEAFQIEMPPMIMGCMFDALHEDSSWKPPESLPKSIKPENLVLIPDVLHTSVRSILEGFCSAPSRCLEAGASHLSPSVSVFARPFPCL